jgi:hypothetical protein
MTVRLIEARELQANSITGKVDAYANFLFGDKQNARSNFVR